MKYKTFIVDCVMTCKQDINYKMTSFDFKVNWHPWVVAYASGK